MQPQGASRELRRQLKELLREADRLAALIQQAEAPRRHAGGRPRLRLIRGGRALVLVPVLWVWAQVREHATAATGIAAAGVLAVPTTLGVGVAGPEVDTGAPSASVTTPATATPSPLRPSSPAPLPVGDTGTAGTVEPGGLPPDPSAPVPAPTPILTLTPTLSPLPEPVEDVVEPVEEVVWTKTTALVHCRDELEVLPLDLRDCVRDLLAS